MGADPLTHAYGEGCVAVRYGLEEAVFLDSVMFWWRTNRGNERNFFDGRWWTYNSLKTYQAAFPWWSLRQLRRVIASCKEKGALLTGNFSEDRRDRTVWYSPSDELLGLYGEGKSICQDGQMQAPETADTFAGTGKCVEEYSNNITSPYSADTSAVTPPSPPTGGSAELPEAAPAPAVSIPLNDGTEYPVAAEQVAQWRELYPAVDVMQQLRMMRGWALANPRKRKTKRGVLAFITRWLAKEQDRGGAGPAGGDYWEQLARAQ